MEGVDLDQLTVGAYPFSRASLEFAKLGVELPQQLRRIVGAAEDGNLQIGMRPEGIDAVIDRLERIANRIDWE